jgi:hypothetical protein
MVAERGPVFALLVAILAIGCRGKADGPARSPKVIEERMVEWPPIWGPGIFVDYETTTDMGDMTALRTEADSIWSAIRPEIETKGACVVQLRASTPTRDVTLGGLQAGLVSHRNWDFILFRDSTGWKWLSTNAPPRRPCVRAVDAR